MPKHFPDWKVKKIAELYTLGFTQAEIAKELGTTRQSVAYTLKSLERRPTKFTTLMVQTEEWGTDWEGRDVDWVEETLNNFRENIEIEAPQITHYCPKCNKQFAVNRLHNHHRWCAGCGVSAIKIKE